MSKFLKKCEKFFAFDGVDAYVLASVMNNTKF